MSHAGGLHLSLRQMAYQLNPNWLPLFLEAGAGAEKGKRWVLTGKFDIHESVKDVGGQLTVRRASLL